MMKNLLTVAQFTFKQLLKSRVMLGSIFLGLGVAFITYVASELTYGQREAVAMDVGMGLASFFSVGVAIFMGVSLISNEIEGRTLYVLLSRPISRRAFILGKMLGMFGILFLGVAVISAMAMMVHFALGGVWDIFMLYTALSVFVEAAVLLSIVVLFSLVVNRVLSVMFVLCTYFAGHTITELMTVKFIKNGPFLPVMKFISFFIPDLEKINLKNYMLYDQDVPMSFIAGGMTHMILYLLAIILISSLIFDRKDLD